ncbi:AMP-binding protein (plasmid) [Streptomyces sp. BB1-1-1]|uniref:AMP-binding protein n=1 Tax=Streptomyces sp. BB1-1-1 TaxID=3074430 RepID=UPI002877849F|nr:AMP-binding protein [Streptomyces sp. BB1-1-1]WND32866.1 AMP-binding protein [Streptomyces sp. BB1-1-1]WND40065.1 AMP-binding protein [Streptomyces sp. BB1-1-1]WND40900.1 AMP-binding protein [Streptomyces sp. BB1-1-1]
MRIERLEPSAETLWPRASLVFCTSGSTGHPKLVPLGDPALCRFADWAATMFGIGDGTKVLSYAPLNFDLSLLEVWTTLSRGGTVIGATGPTLRDAKHLAQLVRRWQPDVIEGVPVLYELLARGLLSLAAGDELTTRHVIMTGDNTPQPTRRAVRDMFPSATYYNVYGSTETNDSLVAILDDEQMVSDQIPLGEPLPGVDIRLVADGGGELVGPGVAELYVATPFQAAGYIDPAGRDEGSFVEGAQISPSASGSTYFRSRDLVERQDDGTLCFIGRRDCRVKVRGVSVDLEDVEDALLRMEAIVEAVALPWNRNGDTSVAAVIRTDTDHTVSSVDVRRFCASRIEPAAVPFRIVFADRPLPRTSTGKIDRNAAVQFLPAPKPATAPAD